MQQPHFAEKLSTTKPSVRPKIPHRPATGEGSDAVEDLRNICIQREYPLPTYVYHNRQ